MAIDRRQQIVEAAAKSFSMFGYKATTMDQVAKIANVGKGTIYTFFTNKEELFQEIMNRLSLEMKRIAEKAIDPNQMFFDNLNAALELLLDFREEHELALKLSQEVREIGTPMALEGLNQLEKAVVGYIAGQVQIAAEKGEIKQCEPEMTAFVMLKLYTALTVEWKKTHEPLEKAKVAERLRFYLEQGLAPV
ncbi:TetR/AcrR family transcriptional regulator [Paenibacillus sp. GSMTC-2017]|uniref:TetR/AcrR family transcriptional regulator n=1 Tax=Paenibacillus sp. GSMTC-2017 TaxID=2794350 RepID=UPI0018D7BBC5|nr:TetR/AcrR family transcriptional regulator [Paenibacillus sp. GSMTC-2017]MBH5318649.1 TetR/AcrR family transcriptional regulator [Paenibacillus sp. GSMTC-2017]